MVGSLNEYGLQLRTTLRAGDFGNITNKCYDETWTAKAHEYVHNNLKF